MTTIAAALADVRNRIAQAARDADRDRATITLVAVSKTQPVAAIEAALMAGQTVFGENRVQEAAAKFPDLRARVPGLRLHLIGPLQTNKAATAIGLVDVIETLDRLRLAESLAQLRDAGHPLPDLLVQVNTGEEPQKAGVLPTQADAFVADCRDRLRLPIRGLMCIPPVDDDPVLHFALLRDMARRLDLPELSMGMSGDFERAVLMGATSVRVGSAIFGARPAVA